MLDPKGQEVGFMARDWIWGKPHTPSRKVLTVSRGAAVLYNTLHHFGKY